MLKLHVHKQKIIYDSYGYFSNCMMEVNELLEELCDATIEDDWGYQLEIPVDKLKNLIKLCKKHDDDIYNEIIKHVPQWKDLYGKSKKSVLDFLATALTDILKVADKTENFIDVSWF